MSVLPPSGAHLSVMDVVNPALPSLDDHYTKVAIVKYYGGIVITVVADAELSITVQWSSDGITFISDLDRIISYDGLGDGGFYERDVQGEYVKMVITNTDVADGEIQMQVYGKLRATGNFDNGVDIDTPVTPPGTSWWFRDLGDVNEVTQLVATSGNVQAGYPGAPTLLQQPTPGLDSYSNVAILGDGSQLTFDWLNRNVLTGVDQAYNGCVFLGNDDNVIMNGPGANRNGVFFNKATYFINESNLAAGFAEDPSLRNNILSSNYDCIFGNLRYSTACNSFNSTISMARIVNAIPPVVPAPEDDPTGRNFFNGLQDSSIFYPGADGADMSYSFFARFYNSQWLSLTGNGNFVAATRMRTTAPTTQVRGVCVLSDHTNPDVVDLSTILPVDTDHRMYCRFSNGYNFYTNADSTSGLTVAAGGSTWNPICDVRHKQDLVNYTDSAGILDRLTALNVYRYHNVSCFAMNPVVEASRFRITPTAQDFHTVFHPEDGDSDAVIAMDRANALASYRDGSFLSKVNELVVIGDLNEGDEPTPAQVLIIEAAIDAEVLLPDVLARIEKSSSRALDAAEVTAALILSIKELKSQVDALTARLTALEDCPVHNSCGHVPPP